MEIPSSETRLKNKIIQDRAKVSGKEAAGKGNSAGSQKSAEGSSDQIALSSKAKDIQKAYAVIQSTSDIRAEKVSEIKGSIENGRYNVKSQNIADKMLKQVLSDSKFLN